MVKNESHKENWKLSGIEVLMAGLFESHKENWKSKQQSPPPPPPPPESHKENWKCSIAKNACLENFARIS